MIKSQYKQKFILAHLIILIFLLISCSNGLDEKLIPGKLLDKKYHNDFFSLQIPSNWEFLKRNEPDYVFGMKGAPFEGYSPNLLVLVLPKNKIKNSDNINNKDEYFEMMQNHINNNMSDYDLVNSTQKVFDKKEISIMKVIIPEKLLKQNHYIFEVDGFYVNTILTSSENQMIDIFDYLSFRN